MAQDGFTGYRAGDAIGGQSARRLKSDDCALGLRAEEAIDYQRWLLSEEVQPSLGFSDLVAMRSHRKTPGTTPARCRAVTVFAQLYRTLWRQRGHPGFKPIGPSRPGPGRVLR